jgi:hypothetical protein
MRQNTVKKHNKHGQVDHLREFEQHIDQDNFFYVAFDGKILDWQASSIHRSSSYWLSVTHTTLFLVHQIFKSQV